MNQKVTFSFEAFEQKTNRLQLFTVPTTGEAIRFSIIKDIPNMQQSVISNNEHWWSEYGQNGGYITCHGGSCCLTQTWNKFTKAYEPMKIKKRFYVPVVSYDKSPNGLEFIANVKVMIITQNVFNKLVRVMQSVEEGTIPFFERDLTAALVKNNNGQEELEFTKCETKAYWLTDAKMTASVNEQLETYYDKLLITVPKRFTEEEFLIEKQNADLKIQQRQQAMSQAVTPQVQPTIQTATLSQPIPQPVPTPQPIPQPVPTPQPVPQPIPQPVPTPQPAPQPIPQPMSQSLNNTKESTANGSLSTPTINDINTSEINLSFDPASLLKN